MKRIGVFLIFVAMVFGAIAGGVYWRHHIILARLEREFTLVSVEFGTLTQPVSATGLLQLQEIFPVGTELGGKVVEVAADFNQVVEEGDVLLRLDDRVAQRKLKQAEVAIQLARAEVSRATAARDAARKKVNRLKELPEDVGLRKELDSAQAQLQAAQAGIEMAEARVREAQEARDLADLNVQMRVVRAPVIARPSEGNGSYRGGVGALGSEGVQRTKKKKFTVLARRVELNQQIGPPASANLFTLGSDVSQMQVRAQVVESDIGNVRKGQAVDFTVLAYADDVHFSGHVSEVRMLPNTDRGAIYYEVIIDVVNSRDDISGEWRLRPGMTASVDILVRQHDHVWKMPAQALNLELDEAYQSKAAKAKLARWPAGTNREDWKPVWIMDEDHHPWPIFVRIGGKNARGEKGIQDTRFVEILEWDPELRPQPAPQDRATYPQVIINAPPFHHDGLFKLPPIKI